MIMKKEMSDCPENRNDLPVNSNNLCWWHSVNFALFHKERYTLETANWTSMPTELKTVYDFYKNPKAASTDIQAARLAMSSKNNTDIQFDKDTAQSAEEYMNILSNIFNGCYYSIPNSGLNEMSWKLYDIYMACSRISSDSDRPIYINFPDDADLMILGFDRGKGGGSQPLAQIQTPVEILRTLILPNKSGGDPFKFELDAVVVRKSWGHYESAIKCSDSDKWLYNKISSTGSTQVLEQYDSFEYMANTKALEKNLILSFYSKVAL